MFNKKIFEEIKEAIEDIRDLYNKRIGALERIDNDIDFNSREFNLYLYEKICGGDELSMTVSIPVEEVSPQNLKLIAFSLIGNKAVK